MLLKNIYREESRLFIFFMLFMHFLCFFVCKRQHFYALKKTSKRKKVTCLTFYAFYAFRAYKTSK